MTNVSEILYRVGCNKSNKRLKLLGSSIVAFCGPELNIHELMYAVCNKVAV